MGIVHADLTTQTNITQMGNTAEGHSSVTNRLSTVLPLFKER